MSNADKTPAIYSITNLDDGRIYIGSTKDVTKRFRGWMSAVNKAASSDAEFNAASNQLIRDIVINGWDNFEFKIIDASPAMQDPYTRSIREVELIMKHRSILPEYGYNATMGGESGSEKHRKAYNRKPKALFLYDTFDDSILLFLKGTKTIPDHIKVRKDYVPDAVQRGKLVKDRYFIFYANTERRKEMAEFIAEYRANAIQKYNGNNDNSAHNTYKRYLKALSEVDEFAKELGFG